MADTSIEWTDKTWSPIRARVKKDAPEIAMLHGWTELAEICERMKGHVGPHCEFVSPGCNHCYSCTNNHRCLPANGTGLPFDKRSRELVDIFVDEKILAEPLRWRRPRKIFVENQSDLFGEWVPDEFIARCFNVMAECPQHIFQVLTKRPDRMQCLMNGPKRHDVWTPKMWHREVLPNVWLGVSAENQQYADERIPLLLQTPAAVRFVSYEPALGPVTFKGMDGARITSIGALDWVIVGGESGPGARPFNIQWARDVVQQCQTAGVPVFVKQLGAHPFLQFKRSIHQETPRMKLHIEQLEVDMTIRLKDAKGGDMEEWPKDLKVREIPGPS